MPPQLSNLINTWNNKYTGTVGDSVADQCFGIVNIYNESFGYPSFTGNAVNIFGQDTTNYTWVENTPDGVPPVGAIVVWGENAQAGTGPNGHCGICVSANVNNLTVFNENAPVGSVCHDLTFGSYAGVIGWGIPKALEAAPAPAGGGTATVKHEAYVRTQPLLTAPLGGSEELAVGAQFSYQGIVTGQNVTENGVTTNLWLHSTKGNYVWSGNCSY